MNNKEYKKQWYEKNKDKVKARVKKYREEHKEEIREKRKEYLKQYNKKYKQTHKEQIKKYNQENKDKFKRYKKKYRENHKEIIQEYDSKYRKKRKQEDYLFNMSHQIRNLIRTSFKRKSCIKANKTEEILGCKMDYFIKYLIKTYENNYNEKWNWNYLKNIHIDHIIPISTAKSEKEIIKLNHYTNLQLLKAEDNIQKSDKLDWRLDNVK